MSDKQEAKNQLKQYGLSDNQIEIYLYLVQNGEKRIRDVVDMSSIPRSTVYESLKGLQSLGLVEETIEGSHKRLRAYPVSSMNHGLQEQIETLSNLAAGLPKLEESLSSLPDLSFSPAAKIRYYKGVIGARQVLWNTLRAKNKMYVYSEWGRRRYVGKNFYQNFVSESFNRGFSEHVITNSTARVLSFIRKDAGTPVSRTKFDNIRMIEENKIKFKGETLMYDNVYAQVFLRDDQINGFEIESAQFVETQRAIFETLWASATPVKKLLR